MQTPLHAVMCNNPNCLICASERAAYSARYRSAARSELAAWVGDKTTHATVALVLALAGLIIWPLSLVSLPLALYATRGRNGHRPLGHRQAVTAAALGGLELAALVLLVIATLTYRPTL